MKIDIQMIQSDLVWICIHKKYSDMIEDGSNTCSTIDLCKNEVDRMGFSKPNRVTSSSISFGFINQHEKRIFFIHIYNNTWNVKKYVASTGRQLPTLVSRSPSTLSTIPLFPASLRVGLRRGTLSGKSTAASEGTEVGFTLPKMGSVFDSDGFVPLTTRSGQERCSLCISCIT